MKPYIINIDKTNTIGKMISKYSEDQFKKGFIIGHISGLCLGGLLVWAILSKNK